MRFDILELHPDILKGIEDAGFVKCTPIQEQSLPECLTGKDMIAQSQTGTGKTAVFLLTIFNRLMNKGRNESNKPRALVMVPTRELAVQVESDSKMLAKHTWLRSVAIFGGVQYDNQIKALTEGVDLVVATPGRMIDLYKSKSLSLDDIEIFVIDEADRMFDMGFAPDICYIADRLPKKKPRQTMLFSATIDFNVKRLSRRYMLPDPVVIEIEPEQVTVDAIDQRVIYTSNEEKVRMLLGLLARPGTERVIIFTNMKRTAEMVGWKLQKNGSPAEVLTGDVTQAKRQKIIDGMKAGTVKVLVATDVAARGLHIDGITHVVNYDLPEDSANYVHRIGRTARAGKSGVAYSLVCEDHALNLPDIEKYIEHKIECEWLEESEIPEDNSGPYRKKRGPSGAGSGPGGGRGTGGRGGGERKGRGGRGKDAGRGPRKAGGKGPVARKATPQTASGGPGEAAPNTAKPAASGDSQPRKRRRRRPRSRSGGGGGARTSSDSKESEQRGSAPRAPKGATEVARPRTERRERIMKDVKVRPVPYAAPPAGNANRPGEGGVLKRMIKSILKGD